MGCNRNAEAGPLDACLGCGAPARLESGLCRRCRELTATERAERPGRRGCTATTFLLAASLALGIGAGSLSGCMLDPHHGHGAGSHTESTAEPHAGHGAETGEPASAEAANSRKFPHDHGTMSTMHGACPWGWLVGGAMAAMMLLMIL